MIVLAHVLIAFLGIIASSLSLASPSKPKIHISYILVGLTLSSGTYLVISTHSALLSSCLTGIGYLAFTSLELVLSHRRLALAQLG